MKKTLAILLVLSLNFIYTFAQDSQIETFLYHPPLANFLTKLNLQTGELLYTVPVKENIWFYVENQTKNAIYVLTKHFGYKIDASTGEVLIEYQFVDVKKKISVFDNPDQFLFPVGLSTEGIGYYRNSDLKSVQSEGNQVYDDYIFNEVSIDEQTNTLFRTLEACSDLPEVKVEDDKITLMAPSCKNTTCSILVEECSPKSSQPTIAQKLYVNLEDYSAIDLNNIFSVSMRGLKIANNILSSQLCVISKDFKQQCFDLQFNVGTKQILSFEQIYGSSVPREVFYGTDFVSVCKCPENPMPEQPEVFIPTKYNKKAQAEAKAINDQRLSDFQKALTEWKNKQEEVNGACEFKIYKIDDTGQRRLIHTIIGTQYAEIYNNRYVFYFDGLYNNMLDLETKKILWSMSL